MRITSIGKNLYPNLNFQGVKFRAISQLPKPSDFDYSPLRTPTKLANQLEGDYKVALKNLFFKDGKLNEDVKKFFDETKFAFKNFEGAEETSTIGDMLAKSAKEVSDFEGELYHATFSIETAQKIRQEGFKPEFISRTKFGPGVYFAFSEGEARNYNSTVLTACCRGKCANMQPKYYDNIAGSPDLLRKLCEFTGLKSQGYPTHNIEFSCCTKMINEYCREFLSKNLGLDFTYGADRSGCALIAHNLDAISDIKFINPAYN